MRRIGQALALLGVAALLAGCAGADANRAQALLQQAQNASRSVSSESFAIRLTFAARGHSGGIAMQGGAELKGERAGDFYLTGIPTGEMAATASTSGFTLVRRGSTITVRTPSGTRTMPLPEAQAQLGTKVGDPTRFLDVAQYVKSVSVGSTTLGGDAVDRIVGSLDTSKLMRSTGGFERNGMAQALLDRVGLHVGDIRAVVYLSRATHLVKVLLADMDISAGGKSAHIHLSIALSRINQPVVFPTP